MCLLHDYRCTESSRKLSAVDVAVFILISLVCVACDVIYSNENSFPNFTVTLSSDYQNHFQMCLSHCHALTHRQIKLWVVAGGERFSYLNILESGSLGEV